MDTSGTGREERTPARLEEFAARSRRVAHQAGLDAAAVEAVEALDAHGVDAILLKGIALSRALYRPDEARGYFDVDILICPAGLAGAEEVLHKLGYANQNELQGLQNAAEVLHAQVWSRWLDGFGNLTIDLHWRIPGCHAPAQAAWDILVLHRDEVEVAGRRLPILDRPGLALHLSLNAAHSGPADAKALGDLRRGLERWAPEIWAAAGDLATRLRSEVTFAAGLRLLPDGARLADGLGLPSAEAVLSEIQHPHERPRGTFHVNALRQANGIGEQARVLWRALVPPRAWIRWEYDLVDGGRLRLLVAYLRHIIRAPAWAIRAWRYRRPS